MSFFGWADEISTYLTRAFQSIESHSRQELEFILGQMPGASRKELAARINQGTYPCVLFLMLDQKDYAESIWQQVKPKGQGQVFRREFE